MYNKSILITGGVVLGSKFVQMLTKKYKPKIVIFSRDEVKQRDMFRVEKE